MANAPIVLTFDAEWPDKPHWIAPDTGIPILLNALEEAQTPAVFFVQGKWARANPIQMKQLVASGHQIGLHGYSHESAHLQSAQGFYQDTAMGVAVLAEFGVVPKFYRYPFGHMDHERSLDALGLIPVGWTNSSDDFRESVNFSPVDVQPGDVILFHTWPIQTVSTIRDTINSLKDRDFSFGDFVVP